MNAERLLSHYEKIADAPDAIARLRRFVLDLAVRGKLAPQDPSDEPASELLRRIASEKARLMKGGKIRRSREHSPLEDRELPFAVPIGWAVAPLDDLSPRLLSDGDWIETKDQSADGGVRLIQLADVGVGEFLNKSARYITEETEIRLNCTRLEVGDVLIARLPNPIGRACIFPDIGQPAITAVDVAILRPDPNLSGEFLVIAMNSRPIREQIEGYGKGATRFRVSTGHLRTVQIPLPPLAEQHRIVTKVDELMALCDRLEAARVARETTRDRFTAASLARLNAPDPSTFANRARFALDALPALTARPDQIKQLRQAILNLAVRGKLVPQDPNDEPTSELLKRIAADKADRAVSARDRRATKIKPLHGDELPFSIPSNWVWASFGDVAISRDGERIPVSREERDQRAKVYDYYGASGVIDKIDGYLFDKPLLLIGEDGANLINRSTPIAFIARGKYWVNNHAHVLDGLSEQFLRYMEMFINAIDLKPYVTGTAQPKMNQAKMNSIPVALPPLAEQHRIVAKVDELMALCDRLEASLAIGGDTRRRLLAALLAEALAPSEDEATKNVLASDAA